MRIVNIFDPHGSNEGSYQGFTVQLLNEPGIFGTNAELGIHMSSITHPETGSPPVAVTSILALLNKLDDELIWGVAYRRVDEEERYLLNGGNGSDYFQREIKITRGNLTSAHIYGAIASLVLRLKKAGIKTKNPLETLGFEKADLREGWTGYTFPK